MRVVLAVILLLFSLSSFAQKQHSFGLFASPSIEKRVWLGDDWIDFKPKASFNFGVLGKYQINDNYILGAGVVVYDKGEKFKMDHIRHPPIVPVQDTVFTRTIGHIGYLSIPLTLRRVVFKSSNFYIHALVGGIYGRRIWDFDMFKNIDGKFYYKAPSSSIKSNFWAANLGLGITYQVTDSFSIEVSPNYIHQLTRGWGESTSMDNNGHFDSYVLDVILWWNFKK